MLQRAVYKTIYRTAYSTAYCTVCQRSRYNYIHWANWLWKTHLVLDSIEKEYKKHFHYIIIICPTLQWNKTYHSKDWIKNDEEVWLIEPKDRLYR